LEHFLTGASLEKGLIQKTLGVHFFFLWLSLVFKKKNVLNLKQNYNFILELIIVRFDATDSKIEIKRINNREWNSVRLKA